ncbi:hypothetical protein [Candidatus Poriferisodalis sp.]|uniref:hypothetical protein n=1 Tax=Candidatus Poriferisodalis sp. TaxID=3101277 RepID=UPI003B01153F
MPQPDTVLSEQVDKRGSDRALLERIALYRNRRELPPIQRALIDELAAWLRTHGTDPHSYVSRLFERHQIVFVGHHTPTRRAGLFLQDLVAAAFGAGVRIVGIEYACVDDQARLDAVVTGAGFDEHLARDALLRWGIRHHFAYREYLDVLGAVWEVNHRYVGSGTPMRVLGLDYDLDMDAVTDTADLRTSYAWPHLRSRGPVSAHMCDVLLAEVIEPGHRALVLTRTAHAMTRAKRLPHRLWDAFDAEIVGGQVVGAGNRVYEAVADRAVTVLIHEPLPADGELGDYALVADGAVDATFALHDDLAVPLAFDTDRGPPARLGCSTSLDRVPLSGLATGWVYLEPDYQRRAPTPLAEPVPAAYVDSARRYAIDPALRDGRSTARDFAAAVSESAAAAELAWTQVL